LGLRALRRSDRLEETNPANLDRDRLVGLAERYGPPELVDDLRRGDGLFLAEASPATGGLEELDDFAACGISRPEDIRDLFVRPFYFGCEADDALNAWGFDRARNPLGARLNGMFGSDIGHFDVVDMAGVLPEAYELVEDGAITAEDFRDFVFGNAARLWTGTDPSFFEGTVVADAVRALHQPTPTG
jgi:hypothetical protein